MVCFRISYAVELQQPINTVFAKLTSVESTPSVLQLSDLFASYRRVVYTP